MGLLLDPALPKKLSGSKMLGNGWVIPGSVLASAAAEHVNACNTPRADGVECHTRRPVCSKATRAEMTTATDAC